MDQHRLDLPVYGLIKRWERFAITLSSRRAKELLELIGLLGALIERRGFLSFEMLFAADEGEWYVKVPQSADLVWDKTPLTRLLVRRAHVTWRIYATDDPCKFASSQDVSEKQLKLIAGISPASGQPSTQAKQPAVRPPAAA